MGLHPYYLVIACAKYVVLFSLSVLSITFAMFFFCRVYSVSLILVNYSFAAL